MISPPAARISQCSRPTAFCSSSSERKELEQTISRQMPVLVREGADLGAHFVDDDAHAHVGGLPRGFGPGHAAADDVNGSCHERGSRRPGTGKWKGRCVPEPAGQAEVRQGSCPR